MATQTIRNGQAIRINVIKDDSLIVVAVSGTYNAEIVQGADQGSIASAATGGTYGPYADGTVIVLTSSATSEIDFNTGTAPTIVSDTVIAAVIDPTTGAQIITAINTGSITGTDASLGITGQAAAQGGAVAAVGGASATSANAGGAVTAVGGAPGATGVGGAVTATGAAVGATSGAGGAVSITGGAGTAGNAAGGAAAVIGGAGQGSAAGGAITITSGAAGATGVAGAVNVAVGAATAGAGSDITVTGGNGAGGTAAGGNINLVPGTAVSTGEPGELLINSVSGLMEVSYIQPLSSTACPASASVGNLFIANRAYRIKAVRGSLVLQGTSVTVNVTKETTTGAPGTGTATGVIQAAMSLAVSNTVVSATMATSVATTSLAAGDRLSFTIGGTVGSATGLTISVLLEPI